ncbi:hypothetical protein, partial, partial [Parasitella parasitica]
MSDNMNNMNNMPFMMGTQESVDDIITDFKFNSILSELQDLKAMVTELYNAGHQGRASANATLSATAS